MALYSALTILVSHASFANEGFHFVLGEKYVIESDRIRLRPFDKAKDSLKSMEEILSAPDTTEFYVMREYRPSMASSAANSSARGVRASNHAYFNNWPDRRAEFVIEDKGSGNIVGIFDVIELKNWNRFEISRVVHPNFRRQGYASEALKVITQWLRTLSPKAKIVAWSSPENHVANSVREKEGFVLTRTRMGFCEFVLRQKMPE